MANFVIKKDGEKESFNAEKIRRAVTGAATKAGLPNEQIINLVEKVLTAVMQSVAGKAEVATTEIKEKVLDELDTLAPSVSEEWRKYDQEK